MGKYWYTDKDGKRKRTKAGIEREYDLFQSSSQAKSQRSARNSARRSAIKKGIVHKGDNMEIDHIHGVSRGNSPSNLRAIPASKNRGRRQASRKRGSKRSRYGDR